jgi:hypothetical protein
MLQMVGWTLSYEAKPPPPNDSFIPRKLSGFQVKKPDMPKKEILMEMRPNNALRRAIIELIQAGGAYIIVSSNGSQTETALKNRVAAMKEAIADEENNQNLQVEFLDRGRVATWVRSHPSMIVWVRQKASRPLSGWHPFENWANPQGELNEEYIFDEGIRLHDDSKHSTKVLSVKEGLQNLRTILAIPGKSVRLAGLSGVGKTRFVQALFDPRVGEHALNPFQAAYTDMSEGPSPDPCSLAHQLMAEKAKTILIIDNCPPDLHNQLTKICSKPQSPVSLLTVEYDVRDDLPEETAVFRLEPAGDEIIEKIIRKRFPQISQIDAQTIATFSGGNPRVAITLANTLRKGETLSGFRDEQLFKRLFWQRHSQDENLLRSAEALSLVYSFEGTDADSQKSELRVLASLINRSGTEVYRDMVKLKNRDLIQQRSVWRAVLPHAIANRLAKSALESIPRQTLLQTFMDERSKRLLTSFTHRLRFLHDCEAAVEIVNKWLEPEGWIGKSVDSLNHLGMKIFKNIAPVSPERALSAIERAANGPKADPFTTRENQFCSEFVWLLRKLAYDPLLFSRCVKLLCRFALSENKDENIHATRPDLRSLFKIRLSGTQAPAEARANIIEELVDAREKEKQELGLLLLDAALQTEYLSSSHDHSFGARPRDYGYAPKNPEEITHWFRIFIGICTRLSLSDKPISEHARNLFARNLRGLWTNQGLYDALEDSARVIHQQKAWNAGWIAVREIVHFDSKTMKPEIEERIHRLEGILKPFSLLEKVRAYVLSDSNICKILAFGESCSFF